MAIDTSVHRLSTEEYSRIAASGALVDARVQLLDGLLVDMSPQGPEHAWVIHKLIRLFAPRADLLHVQMPVETEEGWVPEPDVALAERPGKAHPKTAHIAVEVAASGLPMARRKTATYARAGVAKYWIVDIHDERVFEHSQPTAGGYEVTMILSGDDILDAGVEGVPATTVAALLGND